jgi:Rrf2 family protein
MISSRFAVAVHILAMIETGKGEPVTSDYIASSVNTNPAVIRRLLSMLARAGLATSQLGAGGGALLARKPAEITLLDVYHAVEDREVFAMHPAEPNMHCFVGRQIKPVLEPMIIAAEEALESQLARRTIADVAKRMLARERAPRRR